MDKIAGVGAPLAKTMEIGLAKPGEAQGPSFAQFLQDAFNQVNAAQKDADHMIEGLVTGQVTDIHQVMIASEKASISMEMAIQIRNKVIEAYQEMMRMTV